MDFLALNLAGKGIQHRLLSTPVLCPKLEHQLKSLECSSSQSTSMLPAKRLTGQRVL